MGRQIFGIHPVYLETFFAKPQASSSAPYPQELNPWRTTIEEPFHMTTEKKSERPEQNRDLRCQSGPSAKDSVIFSGGDSLKNYGADQQRLQISDLHFDKFPTPATFACWMTRFKTELCTCLHFPTEAMQWIKEVELVDSVDELRSSSSTRGISMPNFEVLDARLLQPWTKSSIIPTTKEESVWKNKRPRKRTVSLRGRQIAYLIYDHFWVTGSHDSVENYTNLFTSGLRNDDIQEFDSKWDGILLSMTKIPLDDILEGLYKWRIRESQKLKTVLELYDLETHQKKLGPDYHGLKLWWREVSSQKFEIIILGAEIEIMRTSWSRIREQNRVHKEFLEIVGNGKPTGNAWKEKMAVSTTVWISVQKWLLSCSRVSEMHREPEVPAVERLDGLARITLEELAITHFCEKWHPPGCLFYKTKSGCRFGEKCSFAHRQVDEQPTKGLKRMMEKVLWLCWKREIGKRENSSSCVRSNGATCEKKW